MVFFFFFQAEDGIRDDLVTGVQTCALPISRIRASDRVVGATAGFVRHDRPSPHVQREKGERELLRRAPTWHGFEDKDRYLAARLGLVCGVVREGSHGAFPPGGFFVAGDFAGEVVAPVRSVLYLDVRVLFEVVVPDRMLGRT